MYRLMLIQLMFGYFMDCCKGKWFDIQLMNMHLMGDLFHTYIIHIYPLTYGTLFSYSNIVKKVDIVHGLCL